MTCPDCTSAATDPNWGGYHANCHGCKVRALANGPQFWRSLSDRRKTPAYEAALVTVYGSDGVEAGNDAVKTEYKRLKKLRGGSP